MTPWAFSKYLIQSAPPDMAENRSRWSFGIYEILDQRNSPIDPRVIHVSYRGVVELPPEAIPDPKDDAFTARLEEAVLKKWKRLLEADDQRKCEARARATAQESQQQTKK